MYQFFGKISCWKSVHNYFCWPGLIWVMSKSSMIFFICEDVIFSGNHDILMPRLLAHEIAHLMGSDHDGDQPKSVFLLLILSFFPLSILAILVGFEYLIVTLSFYECQVRPFPPSHDLDCSISFWHYLPFTGQHTAYTKTGQVFHVKKGKI